jgi:hypothetical protein
VGAGTDLEQRVVTRRRVGVGIVELVPEHAGDPRVRTLKDNLADRLTVLLMGIVIAAQVADVVTTMRALSGRVGIEDNPVLRQLMLRSPASAYAVKLLLVGAVLLMVLSRLRGRRVHVALAVAAAVSVVAPLLNLALLMRW